MSVAQHSGSLSVGSRPDRSVSLDARNPESRMDQAFLKDALAQRDDKSVEPYFGWAQPGADFLGGILSPDPVVYGWDAAPPGMDGSLSQHYPGEGAPPVNPLVLQRLQAELPLGKLRLGATAASRPVIRMNPKGLVDDWVEARRLNVQPSDSADFWFRTERLPVGNLRIASSEVPAGSRYYRDPEGLVSRYKTRETAAQTFAPAQHGWTPPGADYKAFLDEAAADLMKARRLRGLQFEHRGGQLRLIDTASGQAVGVVSDVPRVGLQPFGVWPDGKWHVGDRIAELGRGS